MRPLIAQFSARTDTGRIRSTNEDNYLVDRRLKLYVVCDGLGGHRGGEVASALAVNAAREVVQMQKHLFDLPEVGDRDAAIEALLREAVAVANTRVHARANETPTLFGMGTTMSLLLVVGARGYLVQIGDSRIYRLRDGALAQLTTDHSLANELGPDSTVAVLHNHVTRAVGVHAEVACDFQIVPVLPGDRFLLASDGLHGTVPFAEIAAALAVPDVADAANALVDRANHGGGKDNITVIVVHFEPAPAESAESMKPSPLFDALRSGALLAALEDDELRVLLASAQVLALMPQDHLVHEGRPIAGLYLVADGEAHVTRGGAELVTTLRGGDFFGEDALLGERASFASIVGGSDGPSSVVLIDRAQFEELQTEHPSIALKLALAVARVLARKVHGAVRETSHTRLIFKDPGAFSRPMPRPSARPQTSPRILADTEPQTPSMSGTPEIPPNTVLQRPRTATRRMHPLPTQPEMPALPEPTSSPALSLFPRRPEDR